jgi:hypothetical protein
MWLMIIVGAVVLSLAAVKLGLVPPPGARTLIYFRRTGIDVTRGTLRGMAREHLRDLAREAGVRGGFVAITAGNRARFSSRIPTRIRQQIRNVLFSQ